MNFSTFRIAAWLVGRSSAILLATVNGAAVTHDDKGNLTGYSGDAYGWDVRGRMTSLARTGLTASFGYDAFGRRSRKTINSAATNYLLDGSDVVSEITGTGTNQTLQGPYIDQPLARDGQYVAANHLGSTTTVTDGTGATVGTYAYTPFGETTQSGAFTPFQYTGRENDGTGLNYNRARYYAPQWGRFISEDPIGFAGGINAFAYCGNNPVNFLDPFGYDGIGARIKNWYMGGMGGFSQWVDAHLMGGATADLGTTTGCYEGGYRTAWDVAKSGANWGGRALLVATTSVQGAKLVYGGAKGLAGMLNQGAGTTAGSGSRAAFEVTADGTAIPTSRSVLEDGSNVPVSGHTLT